MKNAIQTILFLLFILPTIGIGQTGFTLRPIKKIEIPFEYKNDLIIIEVLFQKTLPLKFIFDTGAEHTILSKKELSDLMNIPYRKEFNIIGADMSTEITAYLVTGVQLQIERMLMPGRSLLVLKDDYLKLEEIAGMSIHGILGADIFKRYVVQINYTRKVITLQPINKFKGPGKDYKEIEVEIFKNKPYIKPDLWFNQSENIPIKLLVDTGASLSLLIHNNSDSLLSLPNNAITGNLAVGLGGELKGYLSRSKKLRIDPFEFKEVITNFQEVDLELDTSFLNGRNGLIGNQILSRFDVIINYPLEKMYLRPNKTFKNKFEFDKSGLVLYAAGTNLNDFTIFDVLPNSPAIEIGLQRNDLIKKINGIPANLLSLGDLNRILRKRVGKKIKLVIKREGVRIKYQFKLRELL